MNNVETVLGPISPDSLKICQMHEHIFIRPTPNGKNNPALIIDDEVKSLAELGNYRTLGGSSIVDAQPVHAGRDIEALVRLSKASGVNIVASTGYHLLGYYDENSPILKMTNSKLYDLFLSEIKDGMLPCNVSHQRTDAKAGIVKAAIPAEGPVGRYETLLTAASAAAHDGNVPIMIHTEAGQNALNAVKICIDMGLEPKNIIICHVDRQASDFAPHDDIASAVVWMEYDTIGRFKYHSDEDEIKLISHMLKKGHLKQLLFSLDTTSLRLKSYGGSIGLGYLFTSFLPQLKAHGIDEKTISAVISDNPKAALCTL